MKTAVVLARSALPHQPTWGEAFAGGLRRHGWRAEVMDAATAPRCDLLVLWGVRNQPAIAEQKRRGGEVCILERGYVGDRFCYSSVSFGGGLNGRGVYRGPHSDASRWQRYFADLMRPWRKDDAGCALIVGQVPGDNAIRGVDIDAFYNRAIGAYKACGLDTHFRPHPHITPRDAGDRMEAARRSLQADLAAASVVVTWNSNTAVDAVLAGVPAVAMDQGSMAWAVTGHELGVRPPKPDRAVWAHWIAWAQWTREEMASGECWAAVGA